MNCPKCGSPLKFDGSGVFTCGSYAPGVGKYQSIECGLMEQVATITKERDALQARVTTLQINQDQRWEMMRELQEVCGTNEVEKAVEYIKGLKAHVKRLEEALELVLKMRNDWIEMQEDGYAGAYYAFVKGNDGEWDSIIKAKETKP